MLSVFVNKLRRFGKNEDMEEEDSLENENMTEMSKSNLEKWAEKTPVINLVWYLRAPLWVFIFYLTQVVIWKQFEPSWDWHQTVYFITATITSVGYGDISPQDDHGKIYCVFFMLIGFLTVTSVMTVWMDEFLHMIEIIVIGYCMKQKTHDELMEEKRKNKRLVIGDTNFVPINYAYAYRKILFSLGLIVVIQFVGVAYMMVSHDWTFLKAIYWSTTTALTVGYGDVAVNHDHTTLIIISVFMIVSTLCVAVALGNFVTVAKDLDHEERKGRQINRLSVLDLLLETKYGLCEEGADHLDHLKEPSMTKTMKKKRLKAIAEDPQHEIHKYCISRLDFVLFMIEKVNGLSREYDIEPILEKFEALDINRSGTLNVRDIFDLEEVLLSSKQIRVQKRMAYRNMNIFDRIAVFVGYKKFDDVNSSRCRIGVSEDAVDKEAVVMERIVQV